MPKFSVVTLRPLKRWILWFVSFVRGKVHSAVVRNALLVRLYSSRRPVRHEVHYDVHFETSLVPALHLCRCGTHREMSQMEASEKISVVFASNHFHHTNGSAIARHSQSLRRMRQVNALTVNECSIFSSEFDRITDSVIVLSKWALRTEMRKRIQQAKTRNNVVLADYVDGVHMPSIDVHIDGFICSSYTELMAMRERQQNAWLVPHAIDDRWYDFFGHERERTLTFHCGYHGAQNNCLFPIELQKSGDLGLLTDVEVYASEPWRDDLRHWANSMNVHFIARPSEQISVHRFKPFNKGFLAAHLGAFIIGARYDNENSYWLGDDYPWMVEDESLSAARDAIRRCRQDFEAGNVEKAQLVMARLRRQSCPVQNASDYLAAFRAAATPR